MTVTTAQRWVLVWQDEFDGSEIDHSKWNFEFGNSGWGNNELQYYTDRRENAYVQDGFLHIQAIKEKYETADYTSARMKTQGKFSITYGKIEARAKVPVG